MSVDGQLAARTDEELNKLLDQFICVRLIQIGGVDLSLFQFDPSLTWHAHFMNADRVVYGRFGTVHPGARQEIKDSNKTVTEEALKEAMRKALQLHKEYQADEKTISRLLAPKTGPQSEWKTIEESPALKNFPSKLKGKVQNGSSCIHCHHLGSTAIDSHIIQKKAIPERLLWLYPLPSVLGLQMKTDRAAVVQSVAAGSVAEKAGFQAGDEILRLQKQPLISIADLQWVLHHFDDKGGKLEAQVRRGGKEQSLTLELPTKWRRVGDFGWRWKIGGYTSLSYVGVLLENMTVDQKKKLGLDENALALRVSKTVQTASVGYGNGPAPYKAGNYAAGRRFRPGDIIVEVDGMKKQMNRSELIYYFVSQKKPGSKAKVTVIRRGQKTSFQVPVPKQPWVKYG